METNKKTIKTVSKFGGLMIDDQWINASNDTIKNYIISKAEEFKGQEAIITLDEKGKYITVTLTDGGNTPGQNKQAFNQEVSISQTATNASAVIAASVEGSIQDKLIAWKASYKVMKATIKGENVEEEEPETKIVAFKDYSKEIKYD